MVASGFGMFSAYSRKRSPNPPQKSTTFINNLPLPAGPATFALSGHHSLWPWGRSMCGDYGSGTRSQGKRPSCRCSEEILVPVDCSSQSFVQTEQGFPSQRLAGLGRTEILVADFMFGAVLNDRFQR